MRSCLGCEPAVRRQLLRVAVDRHGRLARLGVGDLVLGVFGPDHAVGPVEHHAAVLLGHAEQLGDDEERELGRDLLDEVGRAALAHRVDDAVGVPDDLLLQVAHHLGGEALVDQPAVARVHGRVHVDHHQLLLGQLVLVHLVEERGPASRGEVLPVPVDVHAVVVAGDGPEATPGGSLLGVPEHRRLPAELGEPVVGHPGHEVAPVDEVDLLEAHRTPLSGTRPCGGAWLFAAITRTCVSSIIGTSRPRPSRPGATGERHRGRPTAHELAT